MKSYRDLDIYNVSFELAIRVHKLSMLLPKHEMYEIGSQVRRSSQSIKDNIVEGYGRRKYKADFIRFLIIAHASLLETISQLEMILALYHLKEIEELVKEYNHLGKMIYKFEQFVQNSWKTDNR